MPPSAEQTGQLAARLIERAGGYLRNTVRSGGRTCQVCTTPTAGYPRCATCQAHARLGLPLADRVGPLAYAQPASQFGYVMRGYKAPRPIAEHRQIVAMLIMTGLAIHAGCAGYLAGMPVTHWAVLPSLPAKPGQHPLRALVAQAAPGQEVPMVAAARTDRPREVDAAHFTAGGLPAGSHVLLVDDTWVSGGHAQSAASALRRAGADTVSVLIAARWLRPDSPGGAAFIRDQLSAAVDYDPCICPWTGRGCPDPR